MTGPRSRRSGAWTSPLRSVRRAGGGVLTILALCSAGHEEPAPETLYRWETLGVEQGLPAEKVLAVAVDGAVVWAGTEGGLVRLEGGDAKTYGVAQGLPFEVVSALAVDPRSGDLWVGTLAGLARVSAGRVDAYTQLDSGLANDVIYGLAVDGSDLWIATAAGLNRFDQGTGAWEIFDVSNTLMHEPWCYAVACAEGDVYVGVWGGGVVVRDRETGTFREHRDPDGEMEIDLDPDDGLVHDVVSSVSVSDGVMWVGTYFGLSRYDGRHWTGYSERDSGLANDFVNQVTAQGESVWVCTDQGLSRFDSERWHTWRHDEAGRWSVLLREADGSERIHPSPTGPASATIYGAAVGSDGLWLATAKGLSHGIPLTPGP